MTITCLSSFVVSGRCREQAIGTNVQRRRGTPLRLASLLSLLRPNACSAFSCYQFSSFLSAEFFCVKVPPTVLFFASMPQDNDRQGQATILATPLPLLPQLLLSLLNSSHHSAFCPRCLNRRRPRRREMRRNISLTSKVSSFKADAFTFGGYCAFVLGSAFVFSHLARPIPGQALGPHIGMVQ